MPSRSPFYDLPDFRKTGLAEVDASLEQWKRDFGAGYSRNLYESERLPNLVSTFSSAVFSLTTVAWGTTVLSKQVGFEGNERVVVLANMTGNVTPNAELTFVTFALFLTTPNGDVFDLSSRTGNFGLTTGAGLGIFGAVSQTWRVEPRIQTGGLHTFALRAHRGGSTANSFEDPGLIVQVF